MPATLPGGGLTTARSGAPRRARHRGVWALAAFVTPLAVTEENFGRVPRVYSEILQDRAGFLCTEIELRVVVLHKNPARHGAGAMRTSENPLKANFGEFPFCALRC